MIPPDQSYVHAMSLVTYAIQNFIIKTFQYQ